MSFCKYCGAELKQDYLFCAECGKRITFDVKEDIPKTVDEVGENIANVDLGETVKNTDLQDKPEIKAEDVKIQTPPEVIAEDVNLPIIETKTVPNLNVETEAKGKDTSIETAKKTENAESKPENSVKKEMKSEANTIVENKTEAANKVPVVEKKVEKPSKKIKETANYCDIKENEVIEAVTGRYKVEQSFTRKRYNEDIVYAFGKKISGKKFYNIKCPIIPTKICSYCQTVNQQNNLECVGCGRPLARIGYIQAINKGKKVKTAERKAMGKDADTKEKVEEKAINS